jgi:hypothetical protein
MTPPRPFLFVSHVSEDRVAAVDIVHELERRGALCWIAPRDVRPGRAFDDEIAAAIDNCAAMVLIFSDRCNESEYIRREVTVAGDAGKTIIPFRIEEARPKGGLRVRLSDLHWIDAFASLDRAINELMRTLESSAGHSVGSVSPPPQAHAASQVQILEARTHQPKSSWRWTIYLSIVAFLVVFTLAIALMAYKWSSQFRWPFGQLATPDVEQPTENMRSADYNEWTLYNVANHRYGDYVRMSTIKKLGDKVVVEGKSILDTSLPDNRMFTEGSYQEGHRVVDCKNNLFGIADHITYNSVGQEVSRYKWAEPQFFEPAFHPPPGSVGESLVKLLCADDLRVPLVQKRELNGAGFVAYRALQKAMATCSIVPHFTLQCLLINEPLWFLLNFTRKKN